MDIFLDGAIAMAFAVAGLFFLRFWRDTRDRLFLTFAIAFWVLAAARIGLHMFVGDDKGESRIYFYLLRLLAYVLILYSILEKNRFFKIDRRNKSTKSDALGGEGA